MTIYDVYADHEPAQVTIEQHPDGSKRVRLADNVERDTTDEATVYRYDEVAFALPDDREGETVESIRAKFDAWWAYGAEDPAEETLGDRVAALEELVLALLEA